MFHAKNSLTTLSNYEVDTVQTPPLPDSIVVNPTAQLELVAKTYAPAVSLPDKVRESLSSEDMERSVFGVTTLLFKTDDNQFIRHELLGSDEGRTEDLCAKVALFGPQYVTHNGETYVIARLMAESPQPQQRVS